MCASFDLERYDVEALASRRGTKWGREGPSVLAAWVADMDFPLAPAITTALADTISRDDLGYPQPGLERRAITSFVERWRTRFSLELDEQLAWCITDVVQGISLSIEALSEPGDAVVFLTPTYPPFFSTVSTSSRRVVAVDLVTGKDGYEIDFGRLQDAIERERPRIFLLCNPHNPTGRAFTRDELNRLGELALRFDMRVVADEIHADLVLGSKSHTSIGALGSELASRTVTLASASKAFNTAGLRCAFVAPGSSAIADRLSECFARTRGRVNVLGLAATIAAFESGDEWLGEVLSYLTTSRDYVKARLDAIEGVSHHPPDATYLYWIDLRGRGLGDDPAKYLRDEASVALSHGTDFGEAGVGHCRLNFATPRPILVEMFDRIEAAL